MEQQPYQNSATGTCSIDKKCCPKKFLLVAIATFALTMLFDWLVHGILLMDTYNATASLWRPQAEMEAMMPYCLLMHGTQALVFSALFLGWKKYQTFGPIGKCGCPGRKGFRFGALVGLLIGLHAAGAYIWQPIPENLALAWLAAETLKWALTAGILALMCASCATRNQPKV